MTDSIRVLFLGAEAGAHFLGDAADCAGLALTTATTPAEGIWQIRGNQFEILIIDRPFEGVDVMEFLDIARRANPELMVIVRLLEANATDAARLVRVGAYTCVDANTDAAEMAALLEQAAEEVRSRRALRRDTEEPWRAQLVGQSPAMHEIARVIRLVARRRCTVLITGETGTGKEMAARAIHMASDRAHLPMVALNCSAIPEHLLEAELFGHTKGAFTGAVNARAGRFEEANNSTLFLDEVGDMPIDLQAKLLRVLQEREFQRLGSSHTVKVNVRVIAASNLDLLERVKQRQFREDLYYRLNVVPLTLPALRERPQDVRLLTRHFTAKICRTEGIAPKEIFNDTLDHLARYQWPGNVRQLENMVEKALVMSGDRPVLTAADFPLPAGGTRLELTQLPTQFVSVPDSGIDFAQTVTIFEKTLVDQALEKANGNKTLAADLLRLKRTTLQSKLRALEAVPA